MANPQGEQLLPGWFWGKNNKHQLKLVPQQRFWSKPFVISKTQTKLVLKFLLKCCELPSEGNQSCRDCVD